MLIGRCYCPSVTAISRFLYPLPVCFQKTNDPRIYNIFEGMQDFINASSAYLYPEFVLKYFPVKAVKVGKEGFKKYKKATLEVLKEMEEKMKSSSEDFTEGTFMEQWKSQGLSYDAIIAIMADFMAAGTDTVSTMYCESIAKPELIEFQFSIARYFICI